MEKKYADNEINYRLLNFLLLNMKDAKLLTDDEVESIRKKLVKKYKPLIGQLDRGGVCEK